MSQLHSRPTNSALGTRRQSQWDYYVCRFVILVIRAEWRQGANTSGSPGARCRQPFIPVVCQTNVTYLVYWAFYPALSPVTWVGFERSQELPILVNTRQDKRTYCSYRHQQQVSKINNKKNNHRQVNTFIESGRNLTAMQLWQVSKVHVSFTFTYLNKSIF